ncbi:uncharacterized protein [Rutidosis leptorrhynchoides]|uniref:uncharacterized protein n=1 Tax=Rutidosis leptorrhynchoides TaxID=125765 RepID=UPI003A998C26
MIQELFSGGATNLLNQDRNRPISEVFEPLPSPSTFPSPSPSSSTTTTTINASSGPNAATSDIQKLRCPRCDSSNTKFCYYNNYNLTQPRHFCKTCRRYWTKGGALRNIPIGGGCRKNNRTTIATTIGKPISANGKLKEVVSSELIGRSSFINGFEHESNPNNNPIIWSGLPQTSHILSLLRATQNPNPNFASTHIKDQSFMVGSNMGSLGFEPLSHRASSLGLCSSLWRNNQQNQHEQQQLGIMNNDHEARNNENNDRYQRLRSNYYSNDQSTPLLLGGNVVNNNTSSSTIFTSSNLDSTPVLTSGELGFWNQNLQLADLRGANNAYN